MTLLLVSLLTLFLISFGITYIPNGDFNEFKDEYRLELHLAITLSFLAFMLIIYSILNYNAKKNRARLNESIPIIHWKYENSYWENFKGKEYKKKGLFYLLRILSIWAPITIVLFFIFKTEPLVSIILILLISIFTIPMIPFTLGKFISELRINKFQKKYEVKIYKNGLTINETYHPFNNYLNRDNGLRLVNIEKLNLYSTNCLRFQIVKRFYSSPTPSGGDFGSVINRNINIHIPIPKNQDIDLDEIKKKIKIN